MDALSAFGGHVSRRATTEAARRSRRYAPVAALGALGMLAVATRLIGLEYSFWEDEMRTVVSFVDRGPSAIFSADSYSINNHALFSFVAWLATGVMGTSEAVHRLGSVVPTLAAFAAVTWWTWRRFGPWSAVATLGVLSLSPEYLDLSRQARGYGLVLLAAAGMLVAVDGIERHGERRWWLVFLVSGLVGMWTLPQTVLLFTAHGLVLLRRPLHRVRAVITVGAGGLLTLLFYAPVLGRMLEEVTRQGPSRRGPQVGWGEIVTGPTDRLFGAEIDLLVPGSATGWVTFVGVAGMASGVVWLVRRDETSIVLHLVLPSILTFAFFAARGTRIFDRYVAYLFIHVAVLLALGLVAAVALLMGRRFLKQTGVAVLTVLASFAVIEFVRDTDELLTLPRENYEEAAAVVTRSDVSGPILTNDGVPYPFRYYLGSHANRLQDLDTPQLEEAVCSLEGPGVFIDYPIRARRRDVPPDLSCIETWDAIRITIPQRAGSEPSWITVWLRT